MKERDKELLKACRKGHLYDFIANESYKFSKEELVQILKNLDYSIYQRLGDQTVEVERILPESLLDDNFFEEDLTADEKAYIEYLSGNRSYKDYLTTCEQEEVEPEPRK